MDFPINTSNLKQISPPYSSLRMFGLQKRQLCSSHHSIPLPKYIRQVMFPAVIWKPFCNHFSSFRFILCFNHSFHSSSCVVKNTLSFSSLSFLPAPYPSSLNISFSITPITAIFQLLSAFQDLTSSLLLKEIITKEIFVL